MTMGRSPTIRTLRMIQRRRKIVCWSMVPLSKFSWPARPLSIRNRIVSINIPGVAAFFSRLLRAMIGLSGDAIGAPRGKEACHVDAVRHDHSHHQARVPARAAVRREGGP